MEKWLWYIMESAVGWGREEECGGGRRRGREGRGREKEGEGLTSIGREEFRVRVLLFCHYSSSDKLVA